MSLAHGMLIFFMAAVVFVRWIGADWAAWQPGGPVGPPARWAANRRRV